MKGPEFKLQFQKKKKPDGWKACSQDVTPVHTQEGG
jgi:hypothetical protein